MLHAAAGLFLAALCSASERPRALALFILAAKSFGRCPLVTIKMLLSCCVQSVNSRSLARVLTFANVLATHRGSV